MKKQVVRLIALALLTLIGAGVHAQTLSVLYNFGNANDPTSFLSPGTLAQGADGNIHTTSQYGGVFVPGYGSDGTVFSMSAAGALSDVYTFEGHPGPNPNGLNPYSGLTLGTDGNFYGTTIAGGVLSEGANASGTVFKIDPQGNLTTLYTFTGGSDGGEPNAAPVEGTDGNFYGTTICGGVQACAAGVGGTVYQMTPSGSLITLVQFDCLTGCGSYAPLVQGTDGNFYGTTTLGGIYNDGSIFEISPLGIFKTLYKFDGTHGANPLAPLIQDSNGSFYGTTELGGANGYGVVFKMTPAGKLTVLHNFADNGTDGADPAGLVQGTDGNLYGVTEEGGTSDWGTIFSISPKGTGYSTLYSFDGTTGFTPEVALLQHTNGLFYGLTEGGGSTGANDGTFYSFDTGLKPFVSQVSTSGAVGSSVGILGQEFSSLSVVKFSGVEALTITVTDTTFITATVPSGAKTGIVTVENARGNSPRTLKSNKKFYVTP
jgi:uncharacterized repeat protein (TIGR03803 family)